MGEGLRASNPEGAKRLLQSRDTIHCKPGGGFHNEEKAVMYPVSLNKVSLLANGKWSSLHPIHLAILEDIILESILNFQVIPEDTLILLNGLRHCHYLFLGSASSPPTSGTAPLASFVDSFALPSP